MIPLAGCSLVAAIAVGAISYLLGDRVVQQSMNNRFAAIRTTLSAASFPLTPSVLETVAELTGTELAAYGPQGTLIDSSHPDVPVTLPISHGPARPPAAGGVEFDSKIVRGYQSRRFTRRQSERDHRAVAHVLVMFDQRDLLDSRIAAASLPLATGLSSTLLLSVVAWLLAQRIIHRIGALEKSVERIASGQFDSSAETALADRAKPDPQVPHPQVPHPQVPGPQVTDPQNTDELGRLGIAVRQMASQLGILWEAVHRQERQKLIHQMAAGLAHQLRNSLTGARMAVELHARRCPTSDGDALGVALRELERTEEYVQRILRIAAKQRQSGTVGSVDDAVGDVRDSLQIVANHHHVDLRWNISERVQSRHVADVAGFTAALENLVLNAIQAGGNAVVIATDLVDDRIQVTVSDDGPGPSDVASGDVFEPFVTTKPEGLGLGLALVRRAAEDLGGNVRWFRDGSKTVFVLTVLPTA